MYGIAFDNMSFYDTVFNDIVFLDVIFTYKEIQIKYLFSNNQPVWIYDTCIVI